MTDPAIDLSPIKPLLSALGPGTSAHRQATLVANGLDALSGCWSRYAKDVETAIAAVIATQRDRLDKAQARFKGVQQIEAAKEAKAKQTLQQAVGILDNDRLKTENSIRSAFHTNWDGLCSRLGASATDLLAAASAPGSPATGAVQRWLSAPAPPGVAAWFMFLKSQRRFFSIGLGLLWVLSGVVWLSDLHLEAILAGFAAAAASMGYVAGLLRLESVLSRSAAQAAVRCAEALNECARDHVTRKGAVEQSYRLIAAACALAIEAAKDDFEATVKTVQMEAGLQFRSSGASVKAGIATLERADRLIAMRARELRQDPNLPSVDLEAATPTSIAETVSDQDRLLIRIGRRANAGFSATMPPGDALWRQYASSLPTPSVGSTEVPCFADFPSNGSLIVRDPRPASEGFAAFVAAIVARLFRQLAPGQVRLLLLDPVASGGSFSYAMKLRDYDDGKTIGTRIWSRRQDIKKQLKDTLDHVETVIQQYLRQDFDTIQAFNEQAAEGALPYRFIFIADFPESFDEEGANDLLRILKNGPRCGVHVVLHRNEELDLPRGVTWEDFETYGLVLQRAPGNGRYAARVLRLPFGPDGVLSVGDELLLDGAPPKPLVDGLIDTFGAALKESEVRHVPYRSVIPDAPQRWASNTATDIIAVPIGSTGVKRHQHFALGKARTSQHHALIVGMTGSGKSSLLHVFVCALAEFYSPEELQLYLVDMKMGGVEFTPYATLGLPHARVVALESEREFAISVLDGLREEMTRRGQLFRASQKQDIQGYRGATGQPLSRIVLIIDEFQMLLEGEDATKREAASLLNQLILQGRSFGIHVVLASSTPSIAGLDHAARDQMGVRIALRCKEGEARIVFSPDNLAPTMLSRAGEAIYNPEGGAVDHNEPFSVLTLAGDLRDDIIRTAARQAAARGKYVPLVFRRSDIPKLGDAAFLTRPAAADGYIDLWCGDSISMESRARVRLERHAGQNALIVSRDAATAFSIVLTATVSLLSLGEVRCHRIQVLDFGLLRDGRSAIFKSMLVGRGAIALHTRRDVAPLLEALASEAEKRTNDQAHNEDASILFVLGLQWARELDRPDALRMPIRRDGEQKTPHDHLTKLLSIGPDVGMHTVFWCDTIGNMEKCLDRNTLRNDVAHRMSGPQTAIESQQLLGDQLAVNLASDRMVLSDQKEPSKLEVFRPFGEPTASEMSELMARIFDLGGEQNVRSD